ncbi:MULTISPECIES: sensor histidine kinase [Sulfitobacter]|jgi:two-component system C4-dicarboxylate transport sensor histidine kinase DctB|uniref:C4-dicarboxylate transport sensor protein DctB n=3 Tax=Pseudomonadota TaxID=1224 RepID=A0A1H2TB43_9RHOB|nr:MULTISPECIES: ATP-binding protein [Sulfitobacter]NKX46760.1 sensor histidine kinase [Rhodobacteraceae bacterium R_SAG8]EAP84458.1 C4-dicarboxylate transport sensor protein DctB, putative [Sulfitobacter sp. EE-36]OAN79641.1 two-component system sensor histidine kinase [Sulfitobacter pontiacus]QLL42899.1 sensor histidine kinase [Sulfitobacter pontiacus]QPO07822.1 sensor histidine kinase [Sulfitobacter sp. B30-2]|tara:strand:+ start:3376 stop:5136 length:1761 start_codon:yes stop_codon:yes gene_type:complete
MFRSASSSEAPLSVSWRVRLAVALLLVIAVATISVTNKLLTDRFTESTRNRAELRIALYSGNLLAELRQNAIVPQLLSRDPALIEALTRSDYSLSTQRLISFVEEIGAASLMLYDIDGRTVAATDRNRLGASHRQEAYFVDALRSNSTVFSVIPRDTGGYRFFYSRRIQEGGTNLGVIAAEVDLQRFERAWAGISDAVIVTDSTGDIIMATEPRWRGLTESEALSNQTPQSAIERAIKATADWTALPADAYLQGEAVMRLSSRIPFRGWRITSYTTYASVREKVNGVLALEVMGFAILLALTFYALSRRTAGRAALFQRESAELRALNAALQREVAERKRVQQTLAVAEQTLEQSSKLAALGEMSAAVSHELNQPLAAMKTYLAGARLLMQRNRLEEALASFGRIDDLIERMGAITRQLKSYARKGQQQFSPFDMGEALASALSMMEPQLRQRQVQINRILPAEPVQVMGDRMRIEQVLVNLLRNALDATKSERNPTVEIILSAGETATLTVRDNGPGIEDLDSLFEPFYTTKQPGDGVGLGLAISSGIVSDLGGRLTARNGQHGGAVFEMQLPIMDSTEKTQAAE